MAINLTTEAALGYANPHGPSPYLRTSCADDAWCIGRWLVQTYRTAPRDVRKSRGDTYHVNGMKVRISYIQGCTEIERIA